MSNFIRTFAICTLLFAFCPAPGMAATCSKANLTRCLDSACAINIGANPAARCQLCGTADAGSANTASNGMSSLSVGASASNTLSAKELKSAPTDPGLRYAWATGECMKKIAGCTEEDVTDTYDKLIEQSCRAAGISAGMAELHAAAKKTKTNTACETEITACLNKENRCGGNLTACEDSAVFDRNFSTCAVEVGGCDQFAAGIRTKLIAQRDANVRAADTLLANIVNAYQSKRETELKTAETSCKNNSARDTCIANVCETNMKNKCGVGYESEKSMATLLCKFYDTACDRIKK